MPGRRQQTFRKPADEIGIYSIPKVKLRTLHCFAHRDILSCRTCGLKNLFVIIIIIQLNWSDTAQQHLFIFTRLTSFVRRLSFLGATLMLCTLTVNVRGLVFAGNLLSS